MQGMYRGNNARRPTTSAQHGAICSSYSCALPLYHGSAIDAHLSYVAEHAGDTASKRNLSGVLTDLFIPGIHYRPGLIPGMQLSIGVGLEAYLDPKTWQTSRNDQSRKMKKTA